MKKRGHTGGGKNVKSGTVVGRALMRKHQQQGAPSTAATREAHEGQHKPLTSVLEMNSLDDFLDTAMMAQRDFSATKERDLLILDAKTGGLTSILPRGVVKAPPRKGHNPCHNLAFRQLKVPRRPAWNTDMSPADLDRAEKDAFLAWRREIAQLEEASGDRAKVTPFEKNLEVWRQLWRVLERSHVVVQIVDARDPLFYYSEDLHAYAEQMQPPRQRLILVNKADYLTAGQREKWAAHFEERGWHYVFFSARKAQEILTLQAREERLRELEAEAEGHYSEDDDVEEEESEDEKEEEDEAETTTTPPPTPQEEDDKDASVVDLAITSTTRVLTREELIGRLKALAETAAAAFAESAAAAGHPAPKATIGMVGFPNVGKSSVINVLMGVTALDHDKARVAVSSTPGKTKHFQTLPLDPATMLCDCPGLVFPSFVATTADMVCAGVLPINQLRDHMAPVDLVCRRVPGPLLRSYYGLKGGGTTDKEVKKAVGQAVVQSAREFLGDLCEARSYWTQGSGVADVNRAARMVLKEYVEGRLVYCHPPPGLEDAEAEAFTRETEVLLSESSSKLEQRLRDLALLEEEEEEEEEGRSNGSDTLRDAAEGGADGEDEEEEEEEGIRSGKVRVRPSKKWGKKGKKLRDKTPYDDEKEVLAAGEAKTAGARVLGRKVMAGSARGFTRVTMPHHYSLPVNKGCGPK